MIQYEQFKGHCSDVVRFVTISMCLGAILRINIYTMSETSQHINLHNLLFEQQWTTHTHINSELNELFGDTNWRIVYDLDKNVKRGGLTYNRSINDSRNIIVRHENVEYKLHPNVIDDVESLKYNITRKYDEIDITPVIDDIVPHYQKLLNNWPTEHVYKVIHRTSSLILLENDPDYRTVTIDDLLPKSLRDETRSIFNLSLLSQEEKRSIAKESDVYRDIVDTINKIADDYKFLDKELYNFYTTNATKKMNLISPFTEPDYMTVCYDAKAIVTLDDLCEIDVRVTQEGVITDWKYSELNLHVQPLFNVML
jgi:hypothetical protein